MPCRRWLRLLASLALLAVGCGRSSLLDPRGPADLGDALDAGSDGSPGDAVPSDGAVGDAADVDAALDAAPAEDAGEDAAADASGDAGAGDDGSVPGDGGSPDLPLCVADIALVPLEPTGSSVTQDISTIGATQSFTTCAPPGGTGIVASFTLTGSSDLQILVLQALDAVHAVGVYRAITDQRCDQEQVGCLAVGEEPTASQTLSALPAGDYWLIVQSYPGGQGIVRVTLSTGAAAAPICGGALDLAEPAACR